MFAEIFKVLLFKLLLLANLAPDFTDYSEDFFSWNFKLFHDNARATKLLSSWSSWYHSKLHLHSTQQFMNIFNVYVTLSLKEESSIERLQS